MHSRLGISRGQALTVQHPVTVEKTHDAIHDRAGGCQADHGRARNAGKPYFITNDEPLPQAEIITRLLEAVGVQARIRPVPLALARAVAGLCEVTWKILPLKSEPPATRFAIEQLATAHWFDISASKRDFGYAPAISIERGLQILRKTGLEALA